MTDKPLAKPSEIRGMLTDEKFKSAIAAALPQHLTPQRFVRIALTAITRTPKLLECDKESVMKCLLQLSQFGLEPDGRLAHLIPFWNSQRKTFECQCIIDYKGLVDLAMRSGKVAYVFADKVCENDEFEWDKGQVKKHVVDFKNDRGKAYAYYALVRNKDGTESARAMTKAEVDAIRARSRAKDSGPWVSDYNEMAKKTVFRNLSKWLQLSPEYRDALEADADALEETRFENAIPIASPVFENVGETEVQGQKGGGVVEEAANSEATPPTSEPAGPKRKLKTKAKKVEIERPMLAKFRTAIGDREPAFIQLAKDNDWIDESKTTLDSLPEEKLAEFMERDNLNLIVEELSKK